MDCSAVGVARGGGEAPEEVCRDVRCEGDHAGEVRGACQGHVKA